MKYPFRKKLRRFRKLNNLHRTNAYKLPHLQVAQHDDYSRMELLRARRLPFKVEFKNVDVLQWFTKDEKHTIRDLIPAHLIDNLDILASSSEKFEGTNVAKDMITMSYDDYESYDGELNLYLAQIPLYKRQTLEDVELQASQRNKSEILAQLNDSQYRESAIAVPPQYHSGLPLQSVNLWASRGYADSGYHYDSYDNFLVLMGGQKIIWLVSSNHTWDAWQTVWDEGYNHLKQDAKFAHKGRRYVRLRAGEMIFIPQGWLHRVISIEDSVAINIWFGGIGHQHVRTSQYQLRYLLNEINKKEMHTNLKKLIREALVKVPPARQGVYRSMASEKNFDALQFESRYRTKNSDSHQTQMSTLVMMLYSEPSVNTIEFLRHIMTKFGRGSESILKLLSPLCLLLVTLKLNDYTQKNQFTPLGGDLLEEFQQQQKEKVEQRESFFGMFWGCVSADFLDMMETIHKKFCKQQMMTMVTQHIM